MTEQALPGYGTAKLAASSLPIGLLMFLLRSAGVHLGVFSRWQTDPQTRLLPLILRDVFPGEAVPWQAAAGRHRAPDGGDRSQPEPTVPHGERLLEINVI